MLSQEILKNLHAITSSFKQTYLLEGSSTWSHQDLCTLLETLQNLPRDLLDQQRAVLRINSSSFSLEPYTEYALRSSYEKDSIGKQLIAEGKIACVILAGGQGTRLGWSGPKALFPILPEEGKTLLQIHLENVQRASSSTPVAIMCSPLNCVAIGKALQQFQEDDILSTAQVELFVQDLLPLVNHEENWFLDTAGRLGQGPDGNGRVFHYLAREGILQRWREEGIEHIVILPIDNPLARPLDPALIDFHHHHAADVTAACVWREDPYEKVGILARCDNKPCIVEYSEIHEDQRVARKEDGSLLWNLANTGIFVFRFGFAAALADKIFPMHAAAKPARFFHPMASTTEEITAWKFETFIFDALPWARKMAALVYPRHQMYAPLKNASGEKSPETVRAAIRAAGSYPNSKKNSPL